MRLLLVELDRFRSRRAIAMLLLAAALLTALLAASAIWDTRPVTADDRTAAEVQAATDAARPGVQQDLAECRERPSDWFGPDATVADCEQWLTPRAEDYLKRQPLRLGLMLNNSGVAVVMLVTALLIIAGTTFAGSDWSSGSVSNQLLFRPRRTQVWVAKAGAVLVGSLVAAAVIIGGFWLTLWLVAAARDVAPPDRVVHAIWWMSLRGVALATAGAVGGFALTMLVRSTVATLAVLFAYAVVGEALVLTLPLGKATQWSPANNVFAWIHDGIRIHDTGVTCPPLRSGCEQAYVLGADHGAAYLGVLLAVAVGVSVLSFARRDVS